jgi:hypothetical protein
MYEALIARLRAMTEGDIETIEAAADALEELKELRLAVWKAYEILGFDTDGDETPDNLSHPALSKLIVDAATEARKDYDDALVYVP